LIAAFLSWLQTSAFATWVAGSSDFYGYPGILTLHTLGMGLAVGTSWVLDLRVLGVARGVPITALRNSYLCFWSGLSINAVTGVVLFAAAAEEKGRQRIFFLKLALILAALVVDTRMRRALFQENQGRVPDERTSTALKAVATISMVLWATAIAAGRLMAYRPVVSALGYIDW
jgi:hypothetical protein